MGGVYLNFGLWAISLFPAWLVIRQIGYTLGDRKINREAMAIEEKVDDEKSTGISSEE